MEEGEDFNADEAFGIADFKLGEKETIGTRQAQRISYSLVTKGLDARTGKARFTVSLWVDTRTKLPLKRVVVPNEKDLDFILTETYSGLTLDGKIDRKRFDLPQK